MNQNNNSTYDHDSNDSAPCAARVPDGDVIERQNQVIKSLYEQIDKHQGRADAERARSALWQAAAADLIDQNAELVKRADHAEASRGEWQRTAEALERRASAPKPPHDPARYVTENMLRAELEEAHRLLELEKRESAARLDVLTEEKAKRADLQDLVHELHLKLKATEGAASGQDRWACLCGLAGCGAPLNHDALCPACLDLVTHRGEEGGEGAEWGRCVECKADRHVWRVHTAADPSGSLVCGHCMALDLAHKVNHPEQTVTITNDITFTTADGQPDPAELAAAVAEAHDVIFPARRCGYCGQDDCHYPTDQACRASSR